MKANVVKELEFVVGVGTYRMKAIGKGCVELGSWHPGTLDNAKDLARQVIKVMRRPVPVRFIVSNLANAIIEHNLSKAGTYSDTPEFPSYYFPA